MIDSKLNQEHQARKSEGDSTDALESFNCIITQSNLSNMSNLGEGGTKNDNSNFEQSQAGKIKDEAINGHQSHDALIKNSSVLGAQSLTNDNSNLSQSQARQSECTAVDNHQACDSMTAQSFLSKTSDFGDQETIDDNSQWNQKRQARKKEGESVNVLPSYTAMIAQAILSKDLQRCALAEIYEFMGKRFPQLKEKGEGWKSCVRHMLSLSDCFLKLCRPKNVRSCHWTIHPAYLEQFLGGDYRKRRRSHARKYAQNTSSEQYPFQRRFLENKSTKNVQNSTFPFQRVMHDNDFVNNNFDNFSTAQRQKNFAHF